jgi:hypothetical protein
MVMVISLPFYLFLFYIKATKRIFGYHLPIISNVLGFACSCGADCIDQPCFGEELSRSACIDS